MEYQNKDSKKAAEIKQRILDLSVILGVKRCDLVDKLDGSNSNFSGKSKYAYPSTKMCVKIAENFPQVSLDWILMGWGSPLRNTPPDTSVHEVVRDRPKPKEPEVSAEIPGFDKLLDKIEEQAKKIALLEYQLDYYKKMVGGGEPDTKPGKKVHPAAPGM